MVNGVSLVPVLPNHRFDETALIHYLRGRLPGFDSEVVVRQFQGGQSNPTFHLQAGDHAYVLRKKPSGKLLPSAHAIDREFAVMKALAGTAVPVPAMHLLCDDESVIGQMFFVMDHIPGRVFNTRTLPGMVPAERAAIYDAAVRTIAALHSVDHRAAGLADYGRAEGYAARQLSRWSKQYQASKVEENPAMDRVIDWLGRHLPTKERVSVVHGDSGLHNMIFHPTEPRVVALIDWELSTIGHPLADLGYFCVGYHLPPGDPRGLSDVDYRALGIPDEAAVTAAYSQYTGQPVEDWSFFLLFSMFRTAAIRAGILKRAMDGNAADPNGMEIGQRYRALAEIIWSMANELP